MGFTKNINFTEEILYQHQGATFKGILKVHFFNFFSVTSAIFSFVTLELERLFKASFCMFPLAFSAESPLPTSVGAFPDGEASTDTFAEALELPTVTIFLGTTTHSVVSTTASARSKVRIPLILIEKCRFALIGADRFRDAYLE